jgi:hypothetical protein
MRPPVTPVDSAIPGIEEKQYRSADKTYLPNLWDQNAFGILCSNCGITLLVIHKHCLRQCDTTLTTITTSPKRSEGRYCINLRMK